MTKLDADNIVPEYLVDILRGTGDGQGSRGVSFGAAE